MTAAPYPAMVLVAVGNLERGYLGEVRLTYAPGTKHDYPMATCRHRHDSTEDARTCARLMASWFGSRYPMATDAQLAARDRREDTE